MNKYKKIIESNGEKFEYYENTLISLGLSKLYILINNYKFFGNKIIDNQDEVKKHFEVIDRVFKDFINRILLKYSCKTLVLTLGSIYTKLQEIFMKNDEAIQQVRNQDLRFKIEYSSSSADLMARKIKTLTEMAIARNNRKTDFCFSNHDYKRLIILLYYYSIYIFYSTRTYFSRKYENGITKFAIDPSSLTPIYTYIDDISNSINENALQYNYDGTKDRKINENFNKAFFEENGITFEDYISLMNKLMDLLHIKNIPYGKIEIQKINEIVKELYPKTDIEKFNSECILKSDSFEDDENHLYKNTCKHRLDTIPFITFDNSSCCLMRGFLCNSIQFWNNVHFIGLNPYTCSEDDTILKTHKEDIVKPITKLLEKDVKSIMLEVNPHFDIYTNRKTKHIFKGKNIEDSEWDIIAVDHEKKYVFDIEVKFLSTSMTESSLSTDLEKIIGSGKSYTYKFEKRIKIENDNMAEFLKFCKSNDEYQIIRIMVVSKVVDLNIESPTRNFKIIHYDGFKKCLEDKYYTKSS